MAKAPPPPPNRSSQSDDDNYNQYLQDRARNNALAGKGSTPFSDEGYARGGKVKKVAKKKAARRGK